jgi:membrane-associated protease RseP (regulator of RpoE activity)
MSNTFTKYTNVLTLVAVLFVIWNILGILDSKNYTNNGYNSDNYTINKIIEGGAAEKAGLQVGDVIKSTGGISVTDTKALNKRQRAKIGETRTFVIDRNGEELSLDLTYTGMSDKNRNLNRIGDMIGLLFIFIGFFVHRKYKSSLSFSFALFAICFGFIFTNGPYISSSGINIAVNVISSSIILFSFTALAVFMLKYPPLSSFIGDEKKRKMIYIPLIIMIVIIGVVQGSQMDRSETLNTVMRLLFAAYIIFFFLVSLITLIRKYRNADSDFRTANGLNSMLIGALIGLLPILIYFTAGTISPDLYLPGYEYVFITFIAIPIFFSMALNQQSNNSPSE